MMSSRYRGILRYDQVIRVVFNGLAGIHLPDTSGLKNFQNMRLVDDGHCLKWVDLYDLSQLWVEQHNGGFILHATNFPDAKTVPIEMTPDDIGRLSVKNGQVYLKNIVEAFGSALSLKIISLKDYAKYIIEETMSIQGTFFSMSEANANYIVSVGNTYNMHLTNLLDLTTEREIQEYNISISWP